MIKAVQRIPTVQYGYIELELEYETPEDAIVDFTRLSKMYEDGIGMSATEWKKTREHMLNTGECDPNEMERMSKAQRYFINELKLTLRGMKAEDPVV